MAESTKLIAKLRDASRLSSLFNEAADALEAFEALLRDLVAQIEEYERINNFAPNPGRTSCWDLVAQAKSLLSTIREAQK